MQKELPIVGSITQKGFEKERLILSSSLESMLAESVTIKVERPIHSLAYMKNGEGYLPYGGFLHGPLNGELQFSALLLGTVADCFGKGPMDKRLLFVSREDLSGRYGVDKDGISKVPLRTVNGDFVSYEISSFDGIPRPPENAVEKKIWETIRHAARMEYGKPLIGVFDPMEEIHDLSGNFNRLTPEVLFYISFEYTDLPRKVRNLLARPGVLHHDQESHHRNWSLSRTNPEMVDENDPAQRMAFRFGAFDTYNALREGRRYNNGIPNSHEGILRFVNEGPNTFTPLQIKYLNDILGAVKDLPEPDVGKISSFDRFFYNLKRIGLSESTAGRIKNIVVDRVQHLRKNYGYELDSFPKRMVKVKESPRTQAQYVA